MTRKRYFDDSYKIYFEANVVNTILKENRLGVILEETYFYPTSGGQPFDQGSLAGFPVVDVTEEEEGIVHWMKDPVQLNGKVEGQIDWSRRFQHMQQHTGQHILSAAFLDRLGRMAETVSFHLGDESCTVDITKRLMTEDEIRAVEQKANEIIWDNRTVKILYPSSDELQKIPLRKDPAVLDQVRIVNINDFDFSPCGGTHVSQTGEIGMIKIKKWEKNKEDLTRIEFVCGVRALRTFQLQNSILNSLANSYSSSIEHVLSNSEKIKTENRTLHKDNKALTDQLLKYEVREMMLAADRFHDIHLIFKVYENGDRSYLRSLSGAFTGQSGVLSVLILKSEDLPIIIAASKDIHVRADELLGELIKNYGGKGGGNPKMAQGGLKQLKPDEILQDVKNHIQKQTNGK